MGGILTLRVFKARYNVKLKYVFFFQAYSVKCAPCRVRLIRIIKIVFQMGVVFFRKLFGLKFEGCCFG